MNQEHVDLTKHLVEYITRDKLRGYVGAVNNHITIGRIVGDLQITMDEVFKIKINVESEGESSLKITSPEMSDELIINIRVK